jgi:hypothetical protein
VGDLVEVFADGAGAPDEEGYPGEEEEGDDEPVGDPDKPCSEIVAVDERLSYDVLCRYWLVGNHR